MICPNCGNFMITTQEYRPFYHYEDECYYFTLDEISKCNKCKIININGEWGEWKIPEQLKPTNKQMKTIAFIESRLDILFRPEVCLKSNCSRFISKYFEKAKQTPAPEIFLEEDCDALGLDESMFY